MKKGLFLSVAFASALSLMAQEEAKDSTKVAKEGFEFTTVKELPITSVKNQNRSGTCWSFSGLGFLESEIIRKGGPETDLSEMFIVYHSYNDKADKYVRMHGEQTFAAGGSFYDVIYVIGNYGIVPEEIFKGLNYGEEKHVHGEIDALTKSYVDVVLKQSKPSPAWKKGYKGVLDAYFGELPAEFTYEGKTYTPQSYAKAVGLNADDYVSITSFNHHPFYKEFILEIPDNWRWSSSYNVPVDEMLEIANNAINKGYTVAWASDVSERGFNRQGIGVLPDIEGIDLAGSDQARWVGLSTKDKNDEINKMLKNPSPEINVTQELRQKWFDNYETTDDHGMQIYGIANDQTEIGRAHV